MWAGERRWCLTVVKCAQKGTYAPRIHILSFHKPYVPLCPFRFFPFLSFSSLLFFFFFFSVYVVCVLIIPHFLYWSKDSHLSLASLASKLIERIPCPHLPLTGFIRGPPNPSNINMDARDLNCHLVPIFNQIFLLKNTESEKRQVADSRRTTEEKMPLGGCDVAGERAATCTVTSSWTVLYSWPF